MISRIKDFLNVPGRGFHAPKRIFWTAFLVRVLYMTLAHTWRIRPFQDHFQFGWETGRIARAVATGYGYSDPFMGHSGPTTWISPLFTLLLAGVFKLFGVYTAASAWIILTINSLFSALTAALIYEIAARCFDAGSPASLNIKRTALWSAWLWALYPAAMQYAVRWIWDTSLSALLLTLAVLLALRIRGIGELQDSDGPARSHGTTLNWALFGFTWGLLALCNPSLLLCLPASLVWILWGMRSSFSSLRSQTTKAALAAVIFAACLAPWVWRNYNVFHAFIPARGNLGAELYQSTREVHKGFPWGETIPLLPTDPEFRHYADIGEARYVREKGELAKINIHRYPDLIVRWTIQRMFFYWAGVPHGFEDSFLIEFFRDINFAFVSIGAALGLCLALHRRIPGGWLIASIFVLQPAIYYVVTVQARFRHPIEPLMTICIVYLFQSAEPHSPRKSGQLYAGAS